MSTVGAKRSKKRKRRRGSRVCRGGGSLYVVKRHHIAIQQFLECWLLSSLRTFCNFFFENHTQIQCFDVKITINK